MKKAAVLLMVYGGLLVINAAIYSWWSSDLSELPRMGVRLVGTALIVWGLWNSAKRAWWVAVLMASVLSVLGVASLAIGLPAGMLVGRPYPLLDITMLAAMVCSLGGTFIILLLPSSRSALQTPSSPPPTHTTP